MECRVVINSLSDFVDSHESQGLWMPESEMRSIEDHLVTCPNCQSVRIELTEIKTAARDLPVHTPPQAMWKRIANVIEAEVPMNERPTREDFPERGWWERLKARKFTFNLPQLAGAGAMAIALVMAGFYFTRTPASTQLNFAGATAALLPDEPEIRADIDRRRAAIEQRKVKWDPQVRADFEQHMAKIEESLKFCRQKLQANQQDAVHQEAMRALYNEQRQLLEDIERLKW